MISQFTPIVQQFYQIFDKINFSECVNCSKCCYLPWLLEEEHNPHLNNFDKNVKKINSTVFIMDFKHCKYVDGNRCYFYKDRPLDCRIFPLDILEEDGKYWWCIFTICPKHLQIREKLIPLIPQIEAVITPEIFEQYKKEIDVAKKIYLPYKLKQYEKIKEFLSG